LVSDLAEDDVLAIEPRSHNSGDKELGAVALQSLAAIPKDRKNKSLRVRSSVGHGQEERPVVPVLEVLVAELLTVDGLATRAVATGEVTTLKHELGDDTVELGARVAEALLTRAKGAEVLSRLGDLLVAEGEVDAAFLLWGYVSN
jgi:hypothetical protein